MCDSKKASRPAFGRAFFSRMPGAGAICALQVLTGHVHAVGQSFSHRFCGQLVRWLVLPAAHFRQPGDGAAGSVAERERLLLMARKLLRFTTLLAVPALGLGLWLWLGYGIGRGGQWLDACQAGVVLLVHRLPLGACAALLRRIVAGQSMHSHTWYRWFNELPVLMLTVAAVVLVVVKPF
jgi:putative membrane protein